ncbi:MAG TPA: acyl-CoA dehydrogenase family protein [Dehalococcoidia bacterium]|nr:acyl-CoA dehydrogenase family protein [Dehalococcoidia bacterium]
MDILSPDPQRTERLVALAGRLADDFATRADEHDRENTFPFENFEAMKRERYTALPVDESLGGLGGSLLDLCLCQERLAQGCGATALAVNMHLFALGTMRDAANAATPQATLAMSMIAQQGWILGGGFTEQEIGGNWGFPTTRAEPAKHPSTGAPGYILNGRKTFTSMAPIIDFFAINATTPGPDGEPVIGTFLAPRATEGLRVVETWDTMSMRATASHDLVLENAWVPEQALVSTRLPGNVDAGANVLFAWFSLSVASVYTGIAIAARDFALRFARERRPVVLERPIAHLPGIQFAAADMEVSLAAARALTLKTAREWMEGRYRDPADLAYLAAPKYIATNTAVQVVDRAMSIVGAVSLFRRHPLQRHYRDVRAGPFHPFSNDVARELIGKRALGIPFGHEPRWG